MTIFYLSPSSWSFVIKLFHMKMSSACSILFHFYANQSHFHKNGFALILALKQSHRGTRSWPILLMTESVVENKFSHSL